jgi:hypothetical protein
MAALPMEEAELYERLRDGDPTAPSDLAVAYLDDLAGWLSAHNPGVDPHLCQSAAEDALLSLMKNPAAYKPELRGLTGYLRMAATGDLRNLLKSERRHTLRSVPFEDVELSGEAGKLIQEDANPAVIVENREAERPAVVGMPVLPAAVQATFTPEEQQVRELMWRREYKTAVYAAVLHIADRPVEEQRQEVKRVKDRIKKRLKRAGVDDV